MALTRSVVDLVSRRTAGQRVTVVRLQVGALSGVLPDAMTFCFDLATAGTDLDGAALEIEQVTGRLACRECGAETPCRDLVRLCACGSADVEVVAGQELRVASVDVEEVVPCA